MVASYLTIGEKLTMLLVTEGAFTDSKSITILIL